MLSFTTFFIISICFHFLFVSSFNIKNSFLQTEPLKAPNCDTTDLETWQLPTDGGPVIVDEYPIDATSEGGVTDFTLVTFGGSDIYNKPTGLYFFSKSGSPEVKTTDHYRSVTGEVVEKSKAYNYKMTGTNLIRYVEKGGVKSAKSFCEELVERDCNTDKIEITIARKTEVPLYIVQCAETAYITSASIPDFSGYEKYQIASGNRESIDLNKIKGKSFVYVDGATTWDSVLITNEAKMCHVMFRESNYFIATFGVISVVTTNDNSATEPILKTEKKVLTSMEIGKDPKIECNFEESDNKCDAGYEQIYYMETDNSIYNIYVKDFKLGTYQTSKLTIPQKIVDSFGDSYEWCFTDMEKTGGINQYNIFSILLIIIIGLFY